MKNTIAMVLALSISPIYSAEFGIGEGSYYSDRAKSIKRIDREITKVNSLSGALLINQPIAVEGKGRVTVVNGVKSVNTSSVTSTDEASLIQINCPERGHKVVVRGALLFNGGNISSHSRSSSATAGAIIVDCNDRYRNDIDIDDIVIINTGTIRATSN